MKNLLRRARRLQSQASDGCRDAASIISAQFSEASGHEHNTLSPVLNTIAV